MYIYSTKSANDYQFSYLFASESLSGRDRINMLDNEIFRLDDSATEEL